MKVPGYMREYVSHIKKECNRYYKEFPENDSWKEIIKQADRVIKVYEKGLITEQEAMRMLSNLPY